MKTFGIKRYGKNNSQPGGWAIVPLHFSISTAKSAEQAHTFRGTAGSIFRA